MKQTVVKLLMLSIITFTPAVLGTNAYFSDVDTIAGNTFATGCWEIPAVPQLTYPQDNYMAGSNSAWNAFPHMDWEDSTTTCPLDSTIIYYYRAFRDQTLQNLVYQSGPLSSSTIPAPNTPEGDYWWQASACDSFGNCSEWSEAWKLTVDRTPPVVKIENLEDDDTVSGTLDINATVTDLHPHHYWFEIYNSSGSRVAGLGTVNEANSFTDTEIYKWDTTKVGNGTYVLKLEARDAADNKEPNEAPVLVDENEEDDSVDWVTVTVNNSESPEERDVVINEIMWMGSSEHVQDEWIELRNTTEGDINLDGWVIDGAASSNGDGRKITLSGSIPANGFYLISYYETDFDETNRGNSEKAAIDDDTISDLVTKDLNLKDNGEKLVLKDANGLVIDETPDSHNDGWAAGVEEGNGKREDRVYKSMERGDNPGDGTNKNNWHTCTDEVCNDGTYWDDDNGNNYGTPKSENHSDNDLTIKKLEKEEPEEPEDLLPNEPAEEEPKEEIIIVPDESGDKEQNNETSAPEPEEETPAPTVIEEEDEDEQDKITDEDATLKGKSEDEESEGGDGEGDDEEGGDTEDAEDPKEEPVEEPKESIESII